jgi:ABC-type polysaccharide/polyol phosphate export permease
VLAALSLRLQARKTRLFTRANFSLVGEMVRATIKASDHNTMLGILWSLVGPISMLIVLYLIFSSRFGAEVQAYPLYLLLGIVLVNFFVTASRFLITVLFTNRSLLLNSTVPRETVLVSNLALHLYKFLIELLLCMLLSAWYGLFTWKSIVLLLPLLCAYLGFVVGVGLLVSLVYSFARDIEHIWNIMSRALFFVTPVFYGLNGISDDARHLVYWLNPLTPFLMALRDALMNTDVGGPDVYAHAMFVGVVTLAIGYGAFLLLENSAVERV